MLAADLVEPVWALCADRPRLEALHRLREQAAEAVPVIDSASHKLIGAVEPPGW